MYTVYGSFSLVPFSIPIHSIFGIPIFPVFLSFPSWNPDLSYYILPLKPSRTFLREIAFVCTFLWWFEGTGGGVLFVLVNAFLREGASYKKAFWKALGNCMCRTLWGIITKEKGPSSPKRRAVLKVILMVFKRLSKPQMKPSPYLFPLNKPFKKYRNPLKKPLKKDGTPLTKEKGPFFT